MEFEIGHLDMIGLDQPPTPRQISSHHPSSLILNELQRETEELQNKLKLNNRRLILFETENNKLIEEKNKLFFENQNTLEKHRLILEKINFLEEENDRLQAQSDQYEEKVKSSDKIQSAQLAELKRFTKFHLKIQNVIKPYIQQLKSSLQQLQQDLKHTIMVNQSLEAKNNDLNQRLITETDFLKMKIKSLELDKTHTVANYEEQIHSFSKEIIRQGQQNDDLIKEIGRLKKSVEFKNYFENELIKFKRIHEDDQRQILSLNEKVNNLSVCVGDKEQSVSLMSGKLMSAESSLASHQQILETTRMQLTKQIDHSELLTERLSRLEKLNLNLSQQMQPKT